ncbi:MAG: ATP-binding cassette domain-containing protein [Floccifex sp.]
MNAIELSHISFSYDNQNDVIKDVSLAIPKGSYTTIVGQNGSGKSTIAKLIIGLLASKSGKVYVMGKELNEENVYDVRSHIGIVFQNPDNQFIGSTVADDIAFGLENHCIQQEKMQAIIEDVAKRVGMQDFLNSEPTKLSGGQKQRVASARAIITNPKLVLADEPTGALDSKSSKMLLERFNYLNNDLQATILMVTHDAFTASYASRVIFIKDGKIFNEIHKGDSSRKEFFDKIIDIVTLLGGDLNDAL